MDCCRKNLVSASPAASFTKSSSSNLTFLTWLWRRRSLTFIDSAEEEDDGDVDEDENEEDEDDVNNIRFFISIDLCKEEEDQIDFF